jgi:hypothetical protein
LTSITFVILISYTRLPIKGGGEDGTIHNRKVVSKRNMNLKNAMRIPFYPEYFIAFLCTEVFSAGYTVI